MTVTLRDCVFPEVVTSSRLTSFEANFDDLFYYRELGEEFAARKWLRRLRSVE